jgi:hypothetical protein
VVFAMSGGLLLQRGVPEAALARPQTHLHARQHNMNNPLLFDGTNSFCLVKLLHLETLKNTKTGDSSAWWWVGSPLLCVCRVCRVVFMVRKAAL